MIRKIIKICLRNNKRVQFLRSCYNEVLAETCETADPAIGIPEASPIHCRVSNFHEKRLNLLIPALAIEHVFGGISTALDFFSHFSNKLDNVRIVLTDQHDFTHKDNPGFPNWLIGELEDQDLPGKWIVAAGNRYGRTLSVGTNDRFIATAWWTAISARAIQDWQTNIYHLATKPNFAYLIQDFEPCFYPWSSRFALAESTYHNTDNVIAVFNSGLLKNFFDTEGYYFPINHTFEPKMNDRLLALRSAALKQEREKRVLVYGRPGVARNAFEIIIMGLRKWVSENPSSSWTIVSAGEHHMSIDLGHGIKLESLGKLSLDEYAMELGRCSIGLSLMISPHPSYPPLEMAAFGMHVVSNQYKSKDLSKLTKLIYSIKSVSPQEIYCAIDYLTKNIVLSEKNTSSGYEWNKYSNANSNFDFLSDKILKQIFL